MVFPFAIHQVHGSEALAKYATLGAAGGGIPVILGSEESVEHLAERFEDDGEPSVDVLLALARRIDAENWFVQRQAEDPEYYDMEENDWPEEDPGSAESLSAHLDTLTRKPLAKVAIAMVPAAEAWMVPCYLRIGGWNECPNAEEHAALFKYWGEKYGAIVACVTDDVIEMTVTRPPATRDDALALAREQYLYCPDIVDQGTESIEALAAALINSTVWFFWWD